MGVLNNTVKNAQMGNASPFGSQMNSLS
jgi:hypothetical protein